MSKPRSGEGICHFLGEVTRAQISDPKALGFPRKDKDEKPLPSFFPFRIVKGEAIEAAAITIKRGRAVLDEACRPWTERFKEIGRER
ncbi:MAG: hypothetical protein QM681_12135 [Novosphingobium sp.]